MSDETIITILADGAPLNVETLLYGSWETNITRYKYEDTPESKRLDVLTMREERNKCFVYYIAFGKSSENPDGTMNYAGMNLDDAASAFKLPVSLRRNDARQLFGPLNVQQANLLHKVATMESFRRFADFKFDAVIDELVGHLGRASRAANDGIVKNSAGQKPPSNG